MKMQLLLVLSTVVAITLYADTYAQQRVGSQQTQVQQPPQAQPQARAQGRGGRGGRGNAGPAVPDPPVPRLPDGTIDLDGLWVGGGPVQDLTDQAAIKEEDIPLLPAARKLMESRRPEDDPHAYCFPQGPVRMTPYPYRFIQNTTHKAPKLMYIIMESSNRSYRQIFMDGRKHPPDPDPTWFGHSIGWWEKDTLVIDSVGFNGMWWFDRRGHPHTEQLHLIERWTRSTFRTLDREVIIDDPGAYSRPWTMKFTARLQPPEDEIMEYICIENNQYGVAGGFKTTR